MPAETAGESAPATTPEPSPTPSADPLEAEIKAMTTEELVGQLLVVGVEGLTPGEDARWAIQEAKVGGVILFGRNVDSAGQLTELTNGLKELNREAGNVPLFLCVDQEGGPVSRMPPEVASLPSAYDWAQAGGDFSARGEALAAECAVFGFSVDLAPVLDIWSNPDNRVIGKRACGTEAETVARLGQDLARGLAQGGVIPVGKHFPGHGDTAVDSHVGLPVVDKPLEQLREFELCPYRRLFDAGLPAVMVGHILMTQIDPEMPASLSPAVVTGLLRDELGFDGVVFSDDLTMGAVTNPYGVGQAAVLAVEAGCDALLVCHGRDSARQAYDALLTAGSDGTLSRERLEESAGRILRLKETYGVDDAPVETPDLTALNAQIKKTLP